MDFDSLLNLEEQFYKEGFDEGVRAGLENNLREGKELGIQTGFQSFVYVGQMRALAACWTRYVAQIARGEVAAPSERVGGRERDWGRVAAQVQELSSLVDSLYEDGEVALTNSDADVGKITSTIKLLRTKARLVAGILAQTELFNELELAAQQVAGRIQSNSTLAPEADMW